PYTLGPAMVTELKAETEAMAKALGVIGLMNVQYAIKDDTIYVLEVNPRASRTVPFVAKATGVPIAKIGARVMAGDKLANFRLDDEAIAPHVAVKEAVFPFARFPDVDTILGPEMKSTGEVMGLDASFERAFAKSQLGAGVVLPASGTVFLSIKDADKGALPSLARRLAEMGFSIMATRGTAAKIREAGLPVTVVNKVLEGRPHCVDAIRSGDVQLVINTASTPQSIADSFAIRRSALTHGVPHYTTMSGARAAVHAIAALKSGMLEVAPLQSYFRGSF
ncbi:MAG: ATP-grasp domain-containing protein, partial [Acetobacteraceae bacterium]|nr:ATP-grasp domain-containing protein [Acetobacteraceae bacterium]